MAVAFILSCSASASAKLLFVIDDSVAVMCYMTGMSCGDM